MKHYLIAIVLGLLSIQTFAKEYPVDTELAYLKAKLQVKKEYLKAKLQVKKEALNELLSQRPACFWDEKAKYNWKVVTATREVLSVQSAISERLYLLLNEKSKKK